MSTKTPTYLATARAFYGEAFDHQKKKALAESMADWAEMDEGEQSFAVAHLGYLNLQAQAATNKLLGQVRDLLDEVAESLTAALEASLPDTEDHGPPEELPPEIDDIAPPGEVEDVIQEQADAADGGAE